VNLLSEFLFARSSFLEGVARLWDLGNFLNEYNDAPTPEQADLAATAADWRAVGDDLRAAMASFEEHAAGPAS